MEQDQQLGDAGERQDPSEQYSTETQVETEPQGDGAAGEQESGSEESGSGDEAGSDVGDPEQPQEVVAPAPTTVAPEDHNAGHNLQAPESGDVSQEPTAHVNGLGMTYSEERGHRMA